MTGLTSPRSGQALDFSMVEGVMEALRRIAVGSKGAVRAVQVLRDGDDAWRLWSPGNCTCSAASYVGITTQNCAEFIIQIRSKRR
jgi:hypothetical protein